MAGSSNAPIPETMEGLRRQNSAYRALIASMEEIQARHTAQSQKYHEAITTLESERAANAELTAMNEKYERDLGFLADDKADFVRDLRNLPEIPSIATMSLLQTNAMQMPWPEIIELGKDLQRRSPLGAVPRKTEYECAAGMWLVIRGSLIGFAQTVGERRGKEKQ